MEIHNHFFMTSLPSNIAYSSVDLLEQENLLVRENSCDEETPSWEWHTVDKDNHFEVCRPDSKSHTGYEILLNHLKQQVFSPSATSTLMYVMLLTSGITGFSLDNLYMVTKYLYISMLKVKLV